MSSVIPLRLFSLRTPRWPFGSSLATRLSRLVCPRSAGPSRVSALRPHVWCVRAPPLRPHVPCVRAPPPFRARQMAPRGPFACGGVIGGSNNAERFNGAQASVGANDTTRFYLSGLRGPAGGGVREAGWARGDGRRGRGERKLRGWTSRCSRGASSLSSEDP